jgi:hypothetical protein
MARRKAAEKKEVTAYDLSELGSTGLMRFGGYVSEELDPEFQGARWRRTIRQMEVDPIIGAMLFVIEMLIRRVIWAITPASDSVEDVKIAQFVQECLDDMSPTWGETLSEILTMIPYGWSFHEIVYKRRLGKQDTPKMNGTQNDSDSSLPSSQYDDGKVGWHRWASRAQNTLLLWEFAENGDLLGMVQNAPPSYENVSIPIDKAMLFRTTSRANNPEGRSMLRGAYTSWFYKTNIQRIEAIGVERDLAGLPVAEVPAKILSSSATDAEKELLSKIKKIVTNIRRDEQEGVVWPKAYDENGNDMFVLKLLSTGGTRQFNTEAIIGRYDQRIAMSVIADFILVGHESVGAYSLSADKTDLFFTAIEAWLDAISDIINRKPIPDLLRLNGYTPDKLPKLTHGEIRKIGLAELGDFLSKTLGGGVLLPDKELENYVRTQANLPLVPPHEDREYVAPMSKGDQTGLDMKGNAKGGAKTPTNQKSKVQTPTRSVSGAEAVAILEAATKVLAEGG